MLAAAMNSPQSQKDSVGAMVLKKMANGITRLKTPKAMETDLMIPFCLSISGISHLPG